MSKIETALASYNYSQLHMFYQSYFNSSHVIYYVNILCTFNLLDTSVDHACTWLSHLFSADACRLWVCDL